MPVLKIEQLSKHYGRLKALDKLDLTVEKGQIMGILGPNGSGKTTTLGVILGILKSSGGHFQWFDGKMGPHYRLNIGAILETPNFFPYLDADDNLEIVRQIKKVENSNFDELLELVKLSGRRKSKFKTYSLGMKQRLAIAATMIGDPDVVIFDEPTNGLDPQGISEVRSTLTEIASRGKTVIMASHILAEVEKICSHVAIIKNGKLLATGPVGAILSTDIFLELRSNDNEKLMGFLRSNQSIKKIEIKGDLIECTASEQLDPSELNASAFNHGIKLSHLVSRKRKLEEEFLEITR